jgi:5-methylcytosine-specific restriction endonuclease McrA
LEQLKQRLKSTFTPEMNWHNYGSYWHIDHIIPVNYFVNKYRITNNPIEKQQLIKECWALSNLQALEGRENIRKQDILPDGTRARHLGKIGGLKGKNDI